MQHYIPSIRSEIITRRTYNRPKENGDYELWDETVDRCISHQQWLWERQINKKLEGEQLFELEKLRNLMLRRVALLSGRTLWLGGTEKAKEKEGTQFNCSFLEIETVSDVVDGYSNLLCGCGVGFKPVVGVLSGFSKKVKTISVVKREKDEVYVKTPENDFNRDLVIENAGSKIWILEIGDSADAWAKSVGKILAQKKTIDHIVINTRRIRPSGDRLKGFGWICSGSENLEKCLVSICNLMNERVDRLLNEIDIIDIMNHLGLSLSSRRSAEIALVDSTNVMVDDFATMKKDHWINNPQRSQSNNSIMFHKKPTKPELKRIFKMMVDSGGSEPGFVNAEAAKKRAPYFRGFNPCVEICLGSKSFCNLVTIDLSKCNDMSDEELQQVFYIMGRANYRQTCVNLKDGILQDTWHELNEFLRLTGVNITGIVQWKKHLIPEELQKLKKWAVDAVNSMADELGLPRSKNCTTVQPSGTLSKIMGARYSETCEGVHKPLGKYIFNNVRFSKHDVLVEKLRKANYYIFNDPYASDSVLIRLPVKYDGIEFTNVDGKEINVESAITQLERYRLLMENYVQHNCSVTISYGVEEVPDIIEWFMKNWGSYVGVSFLFRNDPSKSAVDLGYPYLPQEVTTKEKYDEYVSQLKPFVLDEKEKNEHFSIDVGASMCVNGVCPEK